MLIFRYGTMSSSKTANAIMTAYDFEHRGLNIIFVKPDLENRDGETIVKSRIGLERECTLWSNFKLMSVDNVDKIIVDEAHFLHAEDIDYLANISDEYNIDVICYGLKTDFQTHLFEGSKRLLELADRIEEIENTCWCGHKAIINARIDKNKNVVKDGDQIMLGGSDVYISLCRKHYNSNEINKFGKF